MAGDLRVLTIHVRLTTIYSTQNCTEKQNSSTIRSLGRITWIIVKINTGRYTLCVFLTTQEDTCAKNDKENSFTFNPNNTISGVKHSVSGICTNWLRTFFPCSFSFTGTPYFFILPAYHLVSSCRFCWWSTFFTEWYPG